MQTTIFWRKVSKRQKEDEKLIRQSISLNPGGMLQASLPEHEFLYIKSVLRKNQQRGQDDCNNEKRQPIKISVNSLPGQQKLTDCYSRTTTPSHPRKIAVKYQQKSHEYYLMDNHDQEVHLTRSTYDRKCMWQEVRQRNTDWSSEEENPNINKPQKVPEANQVDQSQEALRRSNQSKHLK